jgi:hypothetical protein
LFFVRLQGEAAAAEELDYETFLAQVKDQSELSFFERQPIGVKINRKVKEISELSFFERQPIGVKFPGGLMDHSEHSFFNLQPIGVNPPEREMDQSKLRFKKILYIRNQSIRPLTHQMIESVKKEVLSVQDP